MISGMMRKRVILLVELLYRNTDENNPITTTEIIEYLGDKGLSADRKTLRKDIELLVEMGYDVVTVKSAPNKYYWGKRMFCLPELKLLAAAVSSARFITESKKRELISKLGRLTSEKQSEYLGKNVFTKQVVKAHNEDIYYILDIISDAIRRNKKIEFLCLEYNAQKERVFRNDGERLLISPYIICQNDDYYYAVGYSDNRQKVVSFRVDRIFNPQVLEVESVEKPKGYDEINYAGKAFEMFGGEKHHVSLQCENRMMKYVIDKFGEEVEVEALDENTFSANIEVALGPVFYSWVFQFSGRIRISSPKEVQQAYVRMLKEQVVAHKAANF